MNAYELADLNDWACCANSKEVSAMLRQQADRIAELETAVTFLRKALDDTLDALSSSIELTKAIQERSRNEN